MALGILCYEMFFGKPPLFQNMTQEEINNNIKNANFDKTIYIIQIKQQDFFITCFKKIKIIDIVLMNY